MALALVLAILSVDLVVLDSHVRLRGYPERCVGPVVEGKCTLYALFLWTLLIRLVRVIDALSMFNLLCKL